MQKRAFTLIEILIVILIIGILLAIAIPQFVRARSSSQQKSCVANLRRISDAKELFAQETGLSTGDMVVIGDIFPTYLKAPTFPQCPGGGTYTINVVGSAPTCTDTGGAYSHELD